MKECKFDGCNRPSRVKGLCRSHYLQQHRGEELRPLRKYKMYPVPAPGKKICTHCERIKDLETEFYKRRGGGVLARCKTCTVAINQWHNEERARKKEEDNGNR